MLRTYLDFDQILEDQELELIEPRPQPRLRLVGPAPTVLRPKAGPARYRRVKRAGPEALPNRGDDPLARYR
jgi:hypothetical protein